MEPFWRESRRKHRTHPGRGESGKTYRGSKRQRNNTERIYHCRPPRLSTEFPDAGHWNTTWRTAGTLLPGIAGRSRKNKYGRIACCINGTPLHRRQRPDGAWRNCGRNRIRSHQFDGRRIRLSGTRTHSLPAEHQRKRTACTLLRYPPTRQFRRSLSALRIYRWNERMGRATDKNYRNRKSNATHHPPQRTGRLRRSHKAIGRISGWQTGLYPPECSDKRLSGTRLQWTGIECCKRKKL